MLGRGTQHADPPVALKEVIAIIRPERWRATQTRLGRLSLPAFTQHRVLGRGCEQGLRYLPRQGACRGAGVRYLPRRMVSWILDEAAVPRLIHAVLEANQTGHPGDGKIFVLPVEQIIELGTTGHRLEALPTLEPVEPATEVRLGSPQ